MFSLNFILSKIFSFQAPVLLTLPLRDPHERRPACLKRFATVAVHFLDRLATAGDAVCRDGIDLRLCCDFAPVDGALVSSFTHRTRQEALRRSCPFRAGMAAQGMEIRSVPGHTLRSEEHTSELQSHSDLVCRLLLE